MNKMLLNNLAGAWVFNRFIFNKQAKRVGLIKGRATCVFQLDNGLYYQENGIFEAIYPRQTWSIYQEYFYYFDTQTKQVTKYSSRQGQARELMYALNIQARHVAFSPASRLIVAQGLHWCLKDCYRVTYHFYFNQDELLRWNLMYHVQGPRKYYRIETHFLKQKPFY